MEQQQKQEGGRQSSAVILLSGVSSGFGRAMALRLGAAGHRVYGISRRALADPELQAALTGYIRGDLCDPALAQQAVDTVLSPAGAVGRPYQ